MRNLKLTPSAPGGGGAAAPQNNEQPAFDPKAFRDEIAASNREMLGQFATTMQETMQNMVATMAQKAPPKDEMTETPGAPSELKQRFMAEMEGLQLTDDQATALMNFVSKVMEMKVPGFKDSILGEVDDKQAAKERLQQANANVAKQYPDVLQNSPLRQAAASLYEALSEGEKKLPNAMANCVREAAANLGIAPLTREQIFQSQSPSPTGQPKTTSQTGEPTEQDYSFAEAFGVSKSAFSESMKLVQMKKRA